MHAITRSELLAQLQSLAPAKDPDKQERVARAVDDYRYFLKTYLPHYTESDTGRSRFRNWIRTDGAQEIEKGGIIEVLAYRGAGKSTQNRALKIWRACKKAFSYNVQISDGETLAQENLEAIKSEFEENELLISDFNIKQGYVWKSRKFVVSVDGKQIMFQSFGTRTRIRGKNFMGNRPDEIDIDDLLNDENVESEDQRTKILKWIKKAVFKLPDRKKKSAITFWGTILHPEDPLVQVSEMPNVKVFRFPAVIEFPININLWEQLYYAAKGRGKEARGFFASNRKALFEGLKVDDEDWLDGELPVAASLMLDYFDDPEVFYCELQVEGGKAKAKVFKPQTYSTLPSDARYYLACDLALGKNSAKGSFIVILVGAKSQQTLKKYVVEAWASRVAPDEGGKKILDFATRYHFHGGAIEAVQFQSYFYDKLKEKALAQGIRFPFSPLSQKQDKFWRIESQTAEINDGDILINPDLRLFLNACADYRGKKSEALTLDLLDTLEMLSRVMDKGDFDYSTIKKSQQNYSSRLLAVSNRHL